MIEAIWIGGAALALFSINLHKARLVSPDPDETGFGTPLRDAFLNLLAWTSFVCIALLAVQYHGLAPILLLLPSMALALWQLRRRFPLHDFYSLANPLALLAPVCIWLLLQRLVGDIPVFDFMTEFTRPERLPVEALLPEGGGS